MSRVNVPVNRTPNQTHEGAPAYAITATQELRRSVMSCLLWENEFYESGQTIADRIKALVPQVAPDTVVVIAAEARERMHLRHVPLLLVREMARHASHRPFVRAALAAVIQRADELSEFLAIYWKDDPNQPLAKSVQRGLADAFGRFSAYQLAKYNRDGAVKLRDVLFIAHPKPTQAISDPFVLAQPRKDSIVMHRKRHAVGQGAAWAQLVDGTLPAPDTWEVAISAAKADEKPAVWARLLAERKLGAMALLRNLRNLQEAKISDAAIAAALVDMQPDRVLPFRFIAAARYAPQFVSELDAAMLKNLGAAADRKLSGTTVLLVDVSGSMEERLSAKSDMTRMDAAAGLAVLARELCERVRVYTFSNHLVECPAYRGLAMAKAVVDSQAHQSTMLGEAVTKINAIGGYDRLVVLTDEQSHDRVPGPNGKGYVVNVASNRHGVGYGPWTHVDGWSERVLDYIGELETEEAR